MIEINLLPEELRKKERVKFELPEVKIGPLVVYIVSGVICLHLIAGGVILLKNMSVKKMSARLEEIMPEKKEYDALKIKVNNIKRKQTSINALMAGRLVWAKKLNDMNDAMMKGVWLTRLYLEEKTEEKAQKKRGKGFKLSIGGRKKKKGAAKAPKVIRYLALEGYASSLYGEETAIIAKFIKSLKDNEGFFADFHEVKLDSIQRKEIKDIEVMRFKIYCYFNEKK